MFESGMAEEIRKLKRKVTDLDKQLKQVIIERNNLVGEVAKLKRNKSVRDEEFHD